MPAPNTLDGLNEKQSSFVAHYLSGMTQRNAAIAAGYSPKSADSLASQTMANPRVKEAIEAQRAKLAKKSATIQEKILDELQDMAFFNAEDVTVVDEDGQVQIDFSRAERRHYKVLTKVKTKTRQIYDNRGKVVGTEKSSEIGLADKYRGLEMLGRHAGLFKTEEQRVVIDVADRLLAARARVMRGPLLEHDDGDADEMPEDTETDHGSTE